MGRKPGQELPQPRCVCRAPPPLRVWASEDAGGRFLLCGAPENSHRLLARQQLLTGWSLGGLTWTVRPHPYPGDTFKSMPTLRPEDTGSESKTWVDLSTWCPEVPPVNTGSWQEQQGALKGWRGRGSSPPAHIQSTSLAGAWPPVPFQGVTLPLSLPLCPGST